MAETSPKKVASIGILRTRPFPPKYIVANGFKLRIDKLTGLIEISLETNPQKGERLVFDPVITRANLDHIKKYVTAVPVDPEDGALRDEILVSEQTGYTNVIHMSRVGNSGETIFGVFSLSDWANQTRQSTRSATGEINSYDSIVLITTTPVQKKLLLELTLLIEQLNKSE
jgi:hypothetical protein